MNHKILIFFSGLFLAVGIFLLILSTGMSSVLGMSAPSHLGFWSVLWCAMGALASVTGSVIRECENRIAKLEERLAERNEAT